MGEVGPEGHESRCPRSCESSCVVTGVAGGNSLGRREMSVMDTNYASIRGPAEIMFIPSNTSYGNGEN